MNASKWRVLTSRLGLDLTARLAGVSASSACGFLSGARPTPAEVAARIHFLVLVTGDLAGAYSETGVRRWFDRPRHQLGGRAPAELLVASWSPEAPGPAEVRALARALAAGDRC